MSIFIAAIIGLVVIFIIGIPILIAVFRSAAQRNPNQPEDEEDQGGQGRESREQRW